MCMYVCLPVFLSVCVCIIYVCVCACAHACAHLFVSCDRTRTHAHTAARAHTFGWSTHSIHEDSFAAHASSSLACPACLRCVCACVCTHVRVRCSVRVCLGRPRTGVTPSTRRGSSVRACVRAFWGQGGCFRFLRLGIGTFFSWAEGRHSLRRHRCHSHIHRLLHTLLRHGLPIGNHTTMQSRAVSQPLNKAHLHHRTNARRRHHHHHHHPHQRRRYHHHRRLGRDDVLDNCFATELLHAWLAYRNKGAS
jgi:hypothetical protein